MCSNWSKIMRLFSKARYFFHLPINKFFHATGYILEFRDLLRTVVHIRTNWYLRFTDSRSVGWCVAVGRMITCNFTMYCSPFKLAVREFLRARLKMSYISALGKDIPNKSICSTFIPEGSPLAPFLVSLFKSFVWTGWELPSLLPGLN